MPTISIQKEDLFQLIGKSFSNEELADYLQLVKGELKDETAGSGEIKIELNDTNRPDLWCVEGIARQIRFKLGRQKSDYRLFDRTNRNDYTLQVEASVKRVRPLIGAFVVKNIQVNDVVLQQLIQTQEKLCENFGQKRKSLAIGIYPLGGITFPVKYQAVDPKSVQFVPLGLDQELNLEQILLQHPKGQQYGHLVKSFSQFPLLTDQEGRILSFPPVINSRERGEVAAGASDLFIEATGTQFNLLKLALNILVYNFADRGGEIVPVTIRYPYPVEGKKTIQFPQRVRNRVELETKLFERLIGEQINPRKIQKTLGEYGCETSLTKKKMMISTLDYRDDYMHPVDVVEDYAISRGFASFKPTLPAIFHTGGVVAMTNLADKVRGIAVGLGFEEMFTNILTRKPDLTEKMMRQDAVVEVENVMVENYSCLRNSLLPGLLKIENTSYKAVYPHKIFEVGEVSVWDPNENHGSRTEIHCALLIAQSRATFSEMHSYLDNLLYYLGLEGVVRERGFSFSIEGRAGEILVQEKIQGHLGEIHPKILTAWEIKVPCVVCELNLSNLLKML